MDIILSSHIKSKVYFISFADLTHLEEEKMKSCNNAKQSQEIVSTQIFLIKNDLNLNFPFTVAKNI